MKKRLYRHVVFAVAAGLALTGCVSSSDVRQEISSARTQAFREWEEQRKTSDGDAPLVSGQLSLEDALKLSLAHNKALLAATEARGIARGQLLSSYSGLLPAISLLGSYTRHDDDAYDQNAMGSLDEYSSGIRITQPVFRGGAARAELRRAQLQACSNDEYIRQITEETLLSVASNYYHALLARQLLTVAEDAVASAEAYLNEVTCKRDSGLATEYSVLRARVDVALYQAQMIQQRSRLNVLTTQLLTEMGVQQDSCVELSGTLVYRPMKPVFEQAMELAYQNRPDLGRVQANVRMSEEAIRLAAGRYWPQVNAFATGGWARPDPYESSRDAWGSQAAAGVCVEWPLFDGLLREGRMVESKAALRQSQFELLDAQERAALQIRQAILKLRDTEEFVESQRMNLQLAREGLRLAEIGYRNGVNTEVDITDARSALTRAMGLHYQAICDHAVARLMLQSACGMLSEGDEFKGVTDE
ncbi:TolC family protein [Tichowtungia aerotolerans]|uniref:TolC family protein n=1 Tax=Tichowtungia aerotolerans TaxID=2697043 RepID=A0A6P1M6U7_9BACT|nr:TolC family protein [Tichowtungia aerotolerans]QHI68314.1 TolC family protein [Tichowtungia aerotolerans]